MELLRGQSSRDTELSKELLPALKRAFPNTYDWLLWWLDAPEDFHVQTEGNAQGWDLKDAGALYDFLASPAARDGALWGYEAVMLSLVISRELREKLDDFVFGTGINFQEFLLTALNWLLEHPGEVKRMLHTDTFWERRDYRGDFSGIRAMTRFAAMLSSAMWMKFWILSIAASSHTASATRTAQWRCCCPAARRCDSKQCPEPSQCRLLGSGHCYFLLSSRSIVSEIARAINAAMLSPMDAACC